MKIRFNLKTLKWYIKDIPIISFDSLKTARAYRNTLEGANHD